MIAIKTKFLGATNYKSARLVATTSSGHRLVLSYDALRHLDTDQEKHEAIATELARKIDKPKDRDYDLVTGFLSEGIYVHTFLIYPEDDDGGY